jgi:hypothetical protein
VKNLPAKLRDPKVIAGIVVVVVIAYFAYKHFAGSSASTSATTQGTTDGGSLETDGDDGSGGGGDWGGGGDGVTSSSDGTDPATGETYSSEIGGINTALTGIPGEIASAIAAIPPPSAASAASSPPPVSGITGSLSSLPIAAQIALVNSGLANPSQLGPKAASDYSKGLTKAPASKKPGATAKLTAAQQRQVSSIVGKALSNAEKKIAAAGHSSHAAGNGAHAQRTHTAPAKVTVHPTPKPREVAPPRPAQKKKAKAKA